MKAKHLFSLLISFFLVGKHAISQVNNANGTSLNNSKSLSLEEEMEGTYLIVQNDNKVVEAFTTEILKTIHALREDKRDVTYQATKNTSIIIFSREKINSPGFKPRNK
jgi:hypothetical protein